MNRTKSKKSLTNSKGISLTEVLFSAVITSIAITGILSVFIQTAGVEKVVNLQYVAMNIAKDRLERSKTLKTTGGFASLLTLTEEDAVVDSSGAPDINGNFKRSTLVTPSYKANSKLTRIDVSVSYKNKGEWKNNAAIAVVSVIADI